MLPRNSFSCRAEFDRGDRARDLAGDERLAAQRALVIEQDAVGGVDAIRLAVIDRDPIGIQLGRGVGAARIERRRFALRHFLHQPVKLGGRRLVEAGNAFPPEDADRLEQPQRADPVGVGGIFRRLETDLDMALRGEVVDLIGLGLLHQTDQVGRVGQIAMMQEKAGRTAVRILVQMVDAAGVERRGTALDAMNDIAFGEQQFG